MATKAELQYKTTRLTLLSEAVTRIVIALLRSATVISCFYLTYKAVEVLAGRETKAQFILSALANLKANQAFVYLFGGGCGIWAFGERALRKKTTKRLQDRIVGLEKRLDPHRSSSGLPASGNTHQGDKP